LSLVTIIKQLEETAHGVAGVVALSAFIKKTYKKTEDAISLFLEKEFMIDPLQWETIKGKVWETAALQDSNKFHFLQGDLISTTLVKRLGAAESNQEYNLWIVKSPSCDCVRSPYIQVAPVIRVDDKGGDNYNRFKSALFFTAPSRFALPKDVDAAHTPTYGYYADFTEPYFLSREDKVHAKVLKSLSYNGWNMFCSVIVNLDGRANLDEERKART